MSKQYRFETLQLHAGHTVDPTGLVKAKRPAASSASLNTKDVVW